MKKTFTVKITEVANGRIVNAIVDQTQYFGITNQYGLTETGYKYKSYIQTLIDAGYEMQVIK